MKLLIYAPNIHTGGGKVLLSALWESLEKVKICRTAFLDSRMRFPELSPKSTIYRIRPRIFFRILGEIKLWVSSKSHSLIFCFGNLPPLFRPKCRCVLYLQNRILLSDDVSNSVIKTFPLKTKLRLTIERFWLKWRIRHVSEVWVQTPSMKKATLPITAPHKIPIRIVPFAPDHSIAPGLSETPKIDFLYVSSGEPHKNHKNLLLAWLILAKKGHLFSLGLTLNQKTFSGFQPLIDQISTLGVTIANYSDLSRPEVLTLYSRSRSLIFPSVLESFGLPLLEAAQAGLPILASRLDFVFDIISPSDTFDPQNPEDIAQCVTRFMQNKTKFTPTPPSSSVLSPDKFVAALVAKTAESPKL